MSHARPTVLYPRKNEAVLVPAVYAYGTRHDRHSLIHGVMLSLDALPIIGRNVQVDSEKGWLMFFDGMVRFARYTLVVFDLTSLQMADPVPGIHSVVSLLEHLHGPRQEAAKAGKRFLKAMYPNSGTQVGCSFPAFGSGDEDATRAEMVRDRDNLTVTGTAHTPFPPYRFNFWFEGLPASAVDTWTLNIYGSGGGGDAKNNLIVNC
jgi:hypothetical protein